MSEAERSGYRHTVPRGTALSTRAGVRGAGEMRSRRSTTSRSRPSGSVRGASGVTWFEPFTEVLQWERPYAKWYLGGKLNIAYNCG